MSAPFITKEEIAQFVKAYADAHPGTDEVIKKAMGSNGTTWGNYNEGLMAFCDAMEKSINEKVQNRLDIWRTSVNNSLRNTLESWRGILNGELNALINYANTHGGQLPAHYTLNYIPNIPEF